MVCQEAAAVNAVAAPYPTLLGCKTILSESDKAADVSKAEAPVQDPRKEASSPGPGRGGAAATREQEEADDREAADRREPESEAQGASSTAEGSADGAGRSPERSVAEQQQEEFWLAASKALEERALREKVLAFLKKHGFSGVNTPKNGWFFSFSYPLHVAVEQNDPGMVSALLKSNAEAHVRDSQGKTPRQLAKSHNFMGSHAEVLKVLKRDRKPGTGAARKARLAAAAAARAAAAAASIPEAPESSAATAEPATRQFADAGVQCNFSGDDAV